MNHHQCRNCGGYHAPDDPYRRSKSAEELAWWAEQLRARERYRWRCRAEDRDRRNARLARLRCQLQQPVAA